MMVDTVSGTPIDSMLLFNYFKKLVGLYFKILPLYEARETSLLSYMENLRDELIGCSGVIQEIGYDPLYMSLISNLQFMIDELGKPSCTKAVYKRKVFGAISICNKLSDKYGEKAEGKDA